ncbi:MAG: chloride channel protein [Candidatus Zixiibacteriota bacterium]
MMKRLDRSLADSILELLSRLRISEQWFLIILASVVGVGGAFGAIIFRELIGFFHILFFDYGKSILSGISPYWIVLIPLIPAVGGLLVGPLTYRWARETKGHGVPEVMEAVALKGGIIRPKVAVVKSLASSICIGSGGSAGREGPIVQIGSALGSTLGQFFRMSGERVKVLVGCGAAAGISATFNAPIAGVFFALEVILGDFAIHTFSPVIISSFVASIISRAFLGNYPAFIVPAYDLVSVGEIPLYMVLGILAGGVSVLFIKLLYKSEDLFESLKIKGYLKPALGGLLLGIIAIFYPQVFGVGYEAINAALHVEMFWGVMFFLIFLKIVATSLTLGSGGSGGIFAPSLFIGAMLGGLFGNLVHTLFPQVAAAPGAYALVGMSAVVAGTTHATLTAMLIIFEMTGDYRIILPLMLASVLSTLLANRLRKESIYTLKLVRKGISLKGGWDVSILTSTFVREVMSKSWETISQSMPMGQLMKVVEESRFNFYPVMNDQGELEGVLSLQDVRNLITKRGLENLIIVKDVLPGYTQILTEDETLASALQKFGFRDVEALPVVDEDNPKKLIGVLKRSDIISFYNRKLLERTGK